MGFSLVRWIRKFYAQGNAPVSLKGDRFVTGTGTVYEDVNERNVCEDAAAVQR
jgi:hypothetical protein